MGLTESLFFHLEKKILSVPPYSDLMHMCCVLNTVAVFLKLDLKAIDHIAYNI